MKRERENTRRAVGSEEKFTQPKILLLDRLHFQSIIINDFTSPRILRGKKYVKKM